MEHRVHGRGRLVGCAALCALLGALPVAGIAPALAPQSEADCLAVVNGIDLHHATMQDLEQAMAAGQVTSAQLVDAYTARIGAYDDNGPAVNSIREVSPSARQQAEARDAERAAGHLGPLQGLPILLKDNVGTIDEPTTAGSIALDGNMPHHDSTVAARLRAAGAVILGKTELSEFANWVSLNMPNGYSSLGGQVINAYTGGDPSGSSSGSGVGTSMAFDAGAIGTETSGSILSPSNANSLVGVKPTTGLVSRFGVIPLAASFDTPGPMTRNVADAARMLGAIAGPDPLDPRTAESGAHLPPGRDYTAGLSTHALEGARIGVEDDGDARLDAALDVLRAQGAVVVDINTNDTDLLSLAELGLIPNEFKGQLNHYLATEASAGIPAHSLDEVILYNQQHPDRVKYGQDLLIASDATPGAQPLSDVAALGFITAERTVADGWFHDHDLDAIVGIDAPYTGTGAAAGYPTVTVPAGYTGTFPYGFSFFGQAWSEAKLLGYAYAFEQATHARIPPTDIRPALLDGVCSGAQASRAAPALPPAAPWSKL